MNIGIEIENKHAAAMGSPSIVCGNSDYTITFTFDAEWNSINTKTARFVFVQNGAVKYTDVVFTGNTVAVPILANTKEVRVGVYAGDLQTTAPARIPCEPSIRCGTGAPADPTPNQYDQIMELLKAGGGGTGGNGKSAYEIAIDNGFEGSEEEWLGSLQGSDAEVVQFLDNLKVISGGDAYSNELEDTSLNTRVKWSCLGDSITDLRSNRPNNYPYWITRNNPSVTVQNLGIGGALICFDRDNTLTDGSPVNSLYTQAQNISSDVDVITVFGGVNDYNWSVPLGAFTTDLTGYPTAKVKTSAGGGTVADSGGVPNGGTFYQGCYRLAKYLRETYPDKPIVWFTPMTYGANSDGKDIQNKYGNTIYQFMDAVKEVASYFSIPCYDLGRLCSINPRIQAMQNKYYLDNLHPNADGSLILSRIIERETKKVLMEWGVNL
jgi:lysophospholipase L1-like esterase